MAFAGVSLLSVPAAAQESADWYLVDERITGPSGDFLSTILFADWNSVRAGQMPMIAISDIKMREAKVNRKFELNIVDSRMNVTINCANRQYNINNIEQYDQDANIIKGEQSDYILDQWTTPNTAGLAELITFTCQPKNKKYEQPFGPTVQPLVGIIGYLNADWSK